MLLHRTNQTFSFSEVQSILNGNKCKIAINKQKLIITVCLSVLLFCTVLPEMYPKRNISDIIEKEVE